METKVTPFGNIYFRYPNNPDMFKLAKRIGFNIGKVSDPEWLAENQLDIIGNIVEILPEYIESVELVIDGEAITDKNCIVNNRKLRKVSAEMAGLFLAEFGGGAEQD